jgi:hypothetical protein
MIPRDRERLVRLSGRARGPSGAEDEEPTVLRIVQAEMAGGMVRLRAWRPPWDGDAWPEFHPAAVVEPAPLIPRSADDVDLLPRGELMIWLERCASLPNLPREQLSGTDYDMIAELPNRWRAGEAISSTEWLAVVKILKHVMPRLEAERVAVPRRLALSSARDLSPISLVAELRGTQAIAYHARHAWIDELRIARVIGRRPSKDARRSRQLARKAARAAEREYIAALNAEG